MKIQKYIFILSVFLIFLLTCSFFVISKNDNLNKIEKRVLNELENQSKTNVIIKFSDSTNISEDIEKINKIIGLKKSKRVFFSANSFSAELTQEEIEKLSQENIVERISPNRKFKVALQNSVGIINATLSWGLQTNNINLTGSGETICIIDTGVNYTHPDLGGCYGNNNVSSNCKVIGGYDFVNSDSNPLDDHGHGTHVTGIATANGTITGVASNAKIIMIKSLNSAGSGSDADILAAIDWCVNNASIFNIAVISMSLGIDCNDYPEYCYSNYCDNQPSESSYRTSINAAFSKNISVIAATGNDNNNTSFSSPACIQNATRVASSSKNDVFSDSSNRGANFQILVAPGDNINSTYLSSSGYGILSGTSMATPHVAGAFALVNQYLRSLGITKTPKQIENVFNNTGKLLNDASSNKNYSRINIYRAFLSFDITSPTIKLIYPSNNTINQSSNITFRCNASDWQLSNITFYLWNSSNGIINQTTFNISGIINQTEINISNIGIGNYKWNCLGTDNKSNYAFAVSNFNLRIGNLSSTSLSPVNNSYTNQNTINFTCLSETSLDYLLSNVTFSLWNSSSFIFNDTAIINGTSNSTIFNYTLNSEGIYYWNCLSRNNAFNSIFSDNSTLTFDITSPNIILESPVEGTSSSTNAYNFTFNATDNFGIANCTLIFDSMSINFLSSVNRNIISGMYNSSLNVASHSWNISCSDLAGNINNSISRSLIITETTTPPTSSSGGGGGGGGSSSSAKTYVISETQVFSGYSNELATDDKIKFSVSGQEHSVSVGSIGIGSVVVIVRSEPMNITLYIGQEKKLNLTSPNYYDLYLKLNYINITKANLTIKIINETIKNIPLSRQIHNDSESNADSSSNGLSGWQNENNKIYIYAIIVIIITIVAFMIMRLRTKTAKINKLKDKKKK